jgi:Ca2+-transporting ATPase
MALMLVATGIVYLLLGEERDGIIMLAALVPVLGVDVVLEARSRTALKKLAHTVSPQAHVIRDGTATTIATGEIVPGDLLELREGDFVHADGVVRWAANLSLDESQLTGESEPQAKQAPEGEPEPRHFFFAGSRVLAGHGWGEVTKTGRATRFGDVARLLAEVEMSQTPLQRRVGHLVRRLSLLAVGVACAVLLLGVLRGQSWPQAFIGAISIAMAAVPEEFPLVFTLFLSVGAFRLGRRGMLVRRLASVETLGSTTVICTDKTGTLTHGEFLLDEMTPTAKGIADKDCVEMAVLACEKHPTDAMDRAIVAYAASRGARISELYARWSLDFDYDFDPVGKHMSHVWSSNGVTRIVAKGSLEGILAHCAIEDRARADAEARNAQLAERGMRVLALASRTLPGSDGKREEDERSLDLVALLGFRDPLRPSAKGAISDCVSAGIAVKMITGDHALTAHAIADEAGIPHLPGSVVTGADLDRLDDAAKAECIRRASIFARIDPSQKYAIVEALEKMGEIVAMTGDGINDAPALRLANIGVSMGRRATEVARAAADLVLLNDDFASIVETIREGRHIYRNIQTAFLYIIAFHVPIVTLALLVPLLGIPLLLQPIHLVWLELVVHPISALVFQSDPALPGMMRQPPRNPSSPMLPRGAVVASVLSGALLTAASLILYTIRLSSNETYARAVAVAVLHIGYMALVWIERRALDPESISLVSKNPMSWAVWVIAAGSYPLICHIETLARAFHVTNIEPADWLLAAALATAAVGWRPVAAKMRFNSPRKR